jgi:mannosyl-3-phosphoglycerate synthase
MEGFESGGAEIRLRLPHRVERFGAVRIHAVQEVLELDSGLGGEDDRLPRPQLVRRVPQDVMNDIERRAAIVVPCRGERLKLLEGVLAGIPHDCLIILVSASPREPVDRFRMEREAVTEFCELVQRPAILVHQHDPGLGAAFVEAGLPEIVDERGLVRRGKGEGMLVGLALTRLSGRDIIGFVDADNYVPGAVREYVKIYAAGVHLAENPYAMVRVSWRAKPKIQDGRLFFHRWGRASQVTNEYLNLLLAEYSGFATDVILTGNAGEHAMTMALAERLRFASGYAVEPHQYVDMFEQFGGVIASPHPDVMRAGVDVFQIETRNPHLHEDKGDEHVQRMRQQSLAPIYHSAICPETVRNQIRDFLDAEGLLVDGAVPGAGPAYPALQRLDDEAFLRTLVEKGETFEQVASLIDAQAVYDTPIPLPDDQQPVPSEEDAL